MKIQDTVKQRFIKICIELKIDAGILIKDYEVGRGTAYNYLNEHHPSQIPLILVSKIFEKYKGLNAYWLLLGEGEMLDKKIKGGSKKDALDSSSSIDSLKTSVLMDKLQKGQLEAAETQELLKELLSELQAISVVVQRLVEHTNLPPSKKSQGK